MLMFFSSRRRHTIFDCDWSSDVCSSDLGVKRERGPKRIAAEKPGESGALAGSGSAVAGDKASAKKWIGNKSLEFANARPIVGLLDLRVGKIERDGAGEIVLIIL